MTATIRLNLDVPGHRGTYTCETSGKTTRINQQSSFDTLYYKKNARKFISNQPVPVSVSVMGELQKSPDRCYGHHTKVVLGEDEVGIATLKGGNRNILREVEFHLCDIQRSGNTLAFVLETYALDEKLSLSLVSEESAEISLKDLTGQMRSNGRPVEELNIFTLEAFMEKVSPGHLFAVFPGLGIFKNLKKSDTMGCLKALHEYPGLLNYTSDNTGIIQILKETKNKEVFLPMLGIDLTRETVAEQLGLTEEELKALPQKLRHFDFYTAVTRQKVNVPLLWEIFPDTSETIFYLHRTGKTLPEIYEYLVREKDLLSLDDCASRYISYLKEYFSPTTPHRSICDKAGVMPKNLLRLRKLLSQPAPAVYSDTIQDIPGTNLVCGHFFSNEDRIWDAYTLGYFENISGVFIRKKGKEEVPMTTLVGKVGIPFGKPLPEEVIRQARELFGLKSIQSPVRGIFIYAAA